MRGGTQEPPLLFSTWGIKSQLLNIIPLRERVHWLTAPRGAVDRRIVREGEALKERGYLYIDPFPVSRRVLKEVLLALAIIHIGPEACSLAVLFGEQQTVIFCSDTTPRIDAVPAARQIAAK